MRAGPAEAGQPRQGRGKAGQAAAERRPVEAGQHARQARGKADMREEEE